MRYRILLLAAWLIAFGSVAVETVTVMKDGDAWRVSGYFIR